MAEPGLLPQAQTIHRHGFAADVNLPQRAETGRRFRRIFLHQPIPVGRRQVGQSDALIDDHLMQRRAVPQRRIAHDYAGAMAQRWEKLLDEAIETAGGELQNPVAFA